MHATTKRPNYSDETQPPPCLRLALFRLEGHAQIGWSSHADPEMASPGTIALATSPLPSKEEQRAQRVSHLYSASVNLAICTCHQIIPLSPIYCRLCAIGGIPAHILSLPKAGGISYLNK